MSRVDNVLHTKRLFLFACTKEELIAYQNNQFEWLEKRLLRYHGEDINEEFREVISQVITLMDAHPDQWLMITLWAIVYQQEMIGSLAFKGPIVNHSLEIGYGLHPDFAHQGYMTEAVIALTQWAFLKPEVHQITATTEPTNYASKKVLLRCGFALEFEDDLCHYVLHKQTRG